MLLTQSGWDQRYRVRVHSSKISLLPQLGDKVLMRQQAAVRKSAGFGLLEVLIASLVFSFGLAGFASLLLASLASATDARQQGAATLAAASLAEQLRANPAAVRRYLEPPALVVTLCEGGTECTPEQQADYDFKLWQVDLANRIGNARGLVCRDGTPQDGGEGDARCDGAGLLVIKIFWPGHSVKTNGDLKWHRYVLEVS